MKYRLAEEEDLNSLAEMRWLHEFEENNCSNVEKGEFIIECKAFLINGLECGNWVYWVAEEDDEIVANIYINKIRKVPKPQKLFTEIGYVTNVHTKEKWRNKGIGTQLLKEAVAWSKENGIELLFVWPSERSVSYYEREGFKEKNEIMELILEE